MRIPAEILEAVWKRQASAGFVSLCEFPDGQAEAFDLSGGPWRGHVVRSDGTLWAWDYDLEGLHALDEHEAIQGIAVGAKRFPELKQVLPARTADARDCEACAGHGFVDFGNHPRFLVCDVCDGVGWLPDKSSQPPDGQHAPKV